MMTEEIDIESIISRIHIDPKKTYIIRHLKDKIWEQKEGIETEKLLQEINIEYRYALDMLLRCGEVYEPQDGIIKKM